MLHTDRYQISFVPLSHVHIESLVEMLDSPHIRPYIDIPVEKQEFAQLVEQGKALEEMGIGVYRTVTIRPPHTLNQHGEVFGNGKFSDPNDYAEGQIAGMTGYTIPQQLEHTAVLGTWLGSYFHGKGLNPIIKREMLSLAFRTPDLKQVIWLVNKHNLRAIRASEKLPYAKRVEDETLRSYRKWHEFKTGASSEMFLVNRDDFFKTL